ncbi:MAG: EFR1 family ferrodoxin, partial [Candidatus Marinimicrobia bacterium]|nr:EFR1 family ferrodoxin [Candidatus Neomarinimicrobiota bacterium]
MNSHYQTASFYISSGTGNSLRVAGWMQKIADSQGLKTQRELVDKYIQKQELADSEEQLVCVFMPTHGFTAPWSVMKFASRMPRVSKTHAVVVATQGRLQFGKFFVPGLSASSTFIISLILTLKGYRVRGVQSVNMPSNWMALHSGQKLANIQRIVDKAQKPSEQFIIKILSCKRCWFSTLNNVEFILGLLLLPISIGYMIYGKEGLAKLFFVNHRCNGCGLCDEYCPNGAIQMNGKKQKYPFWTFRCESCMRCMAFCPEKAIEIHQNSFGNRSSIQRFIDIKACALCLLSGYLVSVFQTGFPAYTNSDRQPDFQLYNVDVFLP